MSILDRIEAAKKSAIPQRLIQGAAVLGKLWREQIRCISEWSGPCPCPAPNDFCEAKKKWLGLVRELHDGKYPAGLSGTEGFLVLECMTEEMLTASGLTILKEVPGARSLIRVGRNGTCLQTILDLQEILEKEPESYADAVESVVRIQEIL